jgi:Ca-activated chloride channel family protein
MTTSRRTPRTGGESGNAAVVAIIVIVLVAVAAIVGVRFLGGDDDGAGNSAEGSGAAGSVPDGCETITVAASSEKAGLLAVAASRFNATNPTYDDTCFGVKVVSKASGDAQAAFARGWDERLDGPRPDVWSPASTVWLRLLEAAALSSDAPKVLPAEDPTSIASTPLVLAMPKPMAKALGWPAKPIGWHTVFDLASNPKGWASVGHPEWGRFKLGKTNPTVSTAGLNATVGAFFAATGTSSDLTEKNVADPKTRRFVAAVESSVIHSGSTTLIFLDNMLRADQDGNALSYVSAVTVEEKQLLDYNLGNPNGDPEALKDAKAPSTPLVAIYPDEGTPVSDNPFVILDAPWVDEVREGGAQVFLDYLLTADMQKLFAESGFRAPDGTAAGAVAASDAVQPKGATTTLAAPSGKVLHAIQKAWDGELRKRARVLLVADTSGSMGEGVRGTGKNRMTLAKEALTHALGEFADTDEVGVWTFPGEGGGDRGYLREIAPVRPLGPGRDGLRTSVSALEPNGGTPLYATMGEAVKEMRASYDPKKVNAVVFLTDGQNDYRDGPDADTVMAELRKQANENGIAVFSVAFGEDADVDVLRGFAEVTRGQVYDLTSNPERLTDVFTEIISIF